MLVAFSLLLLMYVGLTLLYALTHTKPTLKPWPLITDFQEAPSLDTHCQVDSDCPRSHVCLGGICVPKLLRGGQCNPDTGRWISHTLKNVTFAVCSCLDGELISQYFFGGNCNMNVGCGVHGTYNPTLHACDCDPGYKAAAAGMTCQKLSPFEQVSLLPCAPDELEVATLDPVKDGFHPDYIARLQGAKCVKRPCSFDALSGRPLKHAKHELDWGCVCDPSKGLFGVKLETQGYLNSEGFDACASILEKDHDLDDVELITYFYLLKRDPISLIRFPRVQDAQLIPLLRGKGGHFILAQSLWRYDYAQYFMKQHPKFRAKMTHAVFTPLVRTPYRWIDYHEDQFEPLPCVHLTHYFDQKPVPRPYYYRALYANPVCHVDDDVADPLFKDRRIANPLHLSDKIPDTFDFYNAFVLQYDGGGRWTLELKYAYKLDLYRAADTNAPKYLK